MLYVLLNSFIPCHKNVCTRKIIIQRILFSLSVNGMFNLVCKIVKQFDNVQLRTCLNHFINFNNIPICISNIGQEKPITAYVYCRRVF